MTHQECRELFIEALYKELDPERLSQFEEHLAICEECSAEYRQMAETLSMMDQRTPPAPDREFWAKYWDTLNTKLDRASGEPVRIISPKIFTLRSLVRSPWAYGIAALFVLALGIYLGRTFFTRDIPGGQMTENRIPESPRTTPVPRDSVDLEVQKYLDRSRVLLQGVVNAEGDSSVDIARQQKISRDLIRQANFLQDALTAPEDQNIRKLVGDLEMVLMQLANYSINNHIPLIELVKQGVDKKSILLKINLEQLRAITPDNNHHEHSDEKNHKSRI